MSRNKKEEPGASAPDNGSAARMRRSAEVAANFGLVLVAISLISPVVGFENVVWNVVFKWIFAAGALLYTAARVAGALGKDEPFRVRRMRRMEIWAGIAFCVASFFWFYNTAKIDSDTLTFRMFNETIVFTLVGALVQIVASWMLAAALKKNQ